VKQYTSRRNAFIWHCPLCKTILRSKRSVRDHQERHRAAMAQLEGQMSFGDLRALNPFSHSELQSLQLEYAKEAAKW